MLQVCFGLPTIPAVQIDKMPLHSARHQATQNKPWSFLFLSFQQSPKSSRHSIFHTFQVFPRPMNSVQSALDFWTGSLQSSQISLFNLCFEAKFSRSTRDLSDLRWTGMPRGRRRRSCPHFQCFLCRRHLQINDKNWNSETKSSLSLKRSFFRNSLAVGKTRKLLSKALRGDAAPGDRSVGSKDMGSGQSSASPQRVVSWLKGSWKFGKIRIGLLGSMCHDRTKLFYKNILVWKCLIENLLLRWGPSCKSPTLEEAAPKAS